MIRIDSGKAPAEFLDSQNISHQKCIISIDYLRSRLRLSTAAVAIFASVPAYAQDVPVSASNPGVSPDEIVVTATRREERLSRVPINITALSQNKMDAQSIRSIEDVARLVPDLTFSNPPGPSGGFNTLAIRGISSGVGAATTAVYIDETPVQPRSLLYTSSNALPRVFDLERIEVLRGPQGTLFGAGAEGGAIRFITPQPNLEEYEGYGRAELASTKSGAPSYEIGAAVGGPIVQDVLGFRVSGYLRRDGGWIDRVSPDSGQIIDKNSNEQVTHALKGALMFKPAEGVEIVPSIYYQRVYENDPSQIWENSSDPGKGIYESRFRDQAEVEDKFTLYSLRMSYDAGAFQFTSNTSYFDRKQRNEYDYSNYVAEIGSGDPFAWSPGDEVSPQLGGNVQKNFVQEVRFQSVEPTWGFIDWVIGGFYSRNKQSGYLDNVTGSVALRQRFGGVENLIDGIYGSTISARNRDTQLAGFANLDVHLSSRLKMQLGVRLSRDKQRTYQTSDGPINGGFSEYAGVSAETTVTPKIGLNYQADDATMLYVSAGKGYRTGGAQQPVPSDASLCGPDLAALGYTASPTSYDSDSLWSYEAGAKTKLFDRLTVDSSVFLIKWKNIQQRVTLPSCGYIYTDNLGSATSKGFDLAITANVADGFDLSAAIGYVDVSIDNTVTVGPSAVLVQEGDAFGGAPWVVTLSGDYEIPVAEQLKAYAHVDFTYRSRSPTVSPNVFTYDPDTPGEVENTFTSLRFGLRRGKLDASVFIKNLTNSSKILLRSHNFVGSPLFYSTTYRPRTIGVTLTGAF